MPKTEAQRLTVEDILKWHDNAEIGYTVMVD